jgi:multimeric flavodoxin WrbA
MQEIYPMWVRAHGIMIVTPVHWFQVTSPLKLMMDRMVCADGGSPDPTRTHGKDAALAKQIELDGWTYAQHLKGRLFSVVAHGDVEGTENVRRSIADWLRAIGLESAGAVGELDWLIGYWQPYATSHRELDLDTVVQDEVRNAARALVEAVHAQRTGGMVNAGSELHVPRQK